MDARGTMHRLVLLAALLLVGAGRTGTRLLFVPLLSRARADLICDSSFSVLRVLYLFNKVVFVS